MDKSSLFRPESAQTNKRVEHFSADGKYKLVITPYSTQPSTWSYSEGSVYEVGSDRPIAVVQRNYASFPFLFIDDHPNGHRYLVCGEDYQGQSVIELDTGKRRDELSEGADEGVGFCWAQYQFDAATQLITVDGCIWAAPYEYRLYDFSAPLNGWPELKCDRYFLVDDKWPEIASNGTVRFFQVEEGVDASTTTCRREGLTLHVESEWVSDAEQARRQQEQERDRRHDEWWSEFTKTDPLYLEYQMQLAAWPNQLNRSGGLGVTYKDWCAGFVGEEMRYSAHLTDDERRHTINIDWGVKTAPVKLTVSRGKVGDTDWHQETQIFREHSPASVRAAFDHARLLLLAD